MPIGVLFWLVLILWLVLGAWFRWPDPAGSWRVLVPDLFPFLALALLGWHTFGPAIK